MYHALANPVTQASFINLVPFLPNGYFDIVCKGSSGFFEFVTVFGEAQVIHELAFLSFVSQIGRLPRHISYPTKRVCGLGLHKTMVVLFYFWLPAALAAAQP